MGASASQKTAEGFDAVRKRATERAGVAVSGRYHRSPKKLEDDYVIESSKVLGSGYNGQVYRAKRKDSQSEEKYAVKGFKLIGIPADMKEDLENEVEVFLDMDHPHVARLVGVYETKEKLTLVMECLNGGELFHRIQQKKRFSEHDAAVATYQMLLSLQYIHSHSVVHRDIKLENYLYESKDGNHLKLIDFGFSKIWDTNTKMRLSCGTLAYAAPEVLGKSYDDQCDLWSLGVCVFILVLGYMPFAGSEDHQKRAIKNGNYLRREQAWQKLSPDAEDFITQLLEVNPKRRLNAKVALEHKWLNVRHGDVPETHEVDQDVAQSLAEFGQASVFRRACMSMMAWSLSGEERARVRDQFLALDTDKSGTISITEFKKVLEDEYHIEDETTLAAFAALDPAHQDEIHYSEFLAAMVSTRINLHDDLLHSTFNRFDVHNTGYITLDDLKEVLGDCFEGEHVENLIEEADTSHDGKISYEEFITYLKHHESDEKHADAAGKLVDHLKDTHGHTTGSTMRKKTVTMEKDGVAGGCGGCCQS